MMGGKEEPGNFKVMRKEENEEMKLLPKLNLSSFELEKLNEIGRKTLERGISLR